MEKKSLVTDDDKKRLLLNIHNAKTMLVHDAPNENSFNYPIVVFKNGRAEFRINNTLTALNKFEKAVERKI